LGLFAPLVQDCVPKAKAVPNNPAEETLIKSRLEMFFLAIAQIPPILYLSQDADKFPIHSLISCDAFSRPR
jgi:hypothetical protein